MKMTIRSIEQAYWILEDLLDDKNHPKHPKEKGEKMLSRKAVKLWNFTNKMKAKAKKGGK
jgi:primase-polymerase (primpol)-like protein